MERQSKTSPLVRRAVLSLSWLVPLVSVTVFVALYATAAWVYPGGTRSDPGRVGFSFSDNYWCDLLDATTHGGRNNPSRPFAMAALFVFCTGLAVFWWSVPALFPFAPRRGVLVRAAGIISALVMAWVATPLHDLAINVAGGLGVVGFVATISAVNARGQVVEIVTWSTLFAALSNFAIWQTGIGLSVLPLIQKVAFALFLGWMVLTSLRLRKDAA